MGPRATSDPSELGGYREGLWQQIASAQVSFEAQALGFGSLDWDELGGSVGRHRDFGNPRFLWTSVSMRTASQVRPTLDPADTESGERLGNHLSSGMSRKGDCYEDAVGGRFRSSLIRK